MLSARNSKNKALNIRSTNVVIDFLQYSFSYTILQSEVNQDPGKG